MYSTMHSFPLTITAILRHACHVHGARKVTTATGDGYRDCTYAELGQHAAQLANALRRIGVTGEQRGATFMWNNTEHLAAYLAAPTIKKIAPKTGPATGGTVVTITGTGLAEASAVSFGANAGKVLSVRSSTSITVESPAGTGTVVVRVTTPGGTSAPAGKGSFKYKTPKTKK